MDASLVFYDIESNLPLRSFSPNPLKIRLALNYKKVAYRTSWTPMANIPQVCQSLGLKANRTHVDGSPYHTFPALFDPINQVALGDSFEIASYLDQTYPDSSPLFLPHTVGLTAAFNAQVDEIFTKHVGLCWALPFPPDQIATNVAIFMKRAALDPSSPAKSIPNKEDLLASLEKALNGLSKSYAHVGGTTDHILHSKGTASAQAQASKRKEIGPWLDGNQPVYADFIVGAWLGMFSETLAKEEWEQVRSWQGGLWGKIHDALEPLRVVP